MENYCLRCDKEVKSLMVNNYIYFYCERCDVYSKFAYAG